MKYIILFSIAFFTSLLFISCSDLKNDISPAPELNIHGDGVFNSSSSNFHGKQLIDSKNKFEDCKQCHSADFSGGTAKVSCITSGCHPSLNVHKDGITNPQSPNFHGKFIADNLSGQMSECATCHGSTYQGGVVSPSCATCHSTISVHQDGILNPGSPNFHGKYIASNAGDDMSKCASCHGNNYQGGIAAPSCATCHSTINVHQDGIVNPGSPNFHGKYIAANLGWDMRACGSCHAANYSGGTAAPSCLTCHTGSNGPEACNTCHGSFSDPTKIAPPRALNGSTQTTYAGVGAHVQHLYQNNLGDVIRCSTCHTVPSSVYANGHLGTDGKAEINFGRLSVQGGANPTYNFTNNTCANTYCHGNFSFSRDLADSKYQFVYTAATMTGNNASVIWNKVDGSQAQCGSCHGLPPTGHAPFSLNQCANCHYGVVDASGNIIDKTKHINGVANVFGN